MVNRQKLYIGLAVSAGVFTGIGVFLYYRHQEKSKSERFKNFRHRHSSPFEIFRIEIFSTCFSDRYPLACKE